jgi:hypothetical protein
LVSPSDDREKFLQSFSLIVTLLIFSLAAILVYLSASTVTSIGISGSPSLPS